MISLLNYLKNVSSLAMTVTQWKTVIAFHVFLPFILLTAITSFAILPVLLLIIYLHQCADTAIKIVNRNEIYPSEKLPIILPAEDSYFNTTIRKEQFEEIIGNNILDIVKINNSIRGEDYTVQVYPSDDKLKERNEISTTHTEECEAILRVQYNI